MGKGSCDVYPIQTHFYFWGFCVCDNFGENPSRNASMRVQIDTWTEANWLYNLSHAICHSYGTDN